MNTELENTEETAEDLQGKTENAESQEQEQVVRWNIVDENQVEKPFVPATEEAPKEEEEKPEETVETVEAEKEVVETVEVVEEKNVVPQIDEQSVINFLKEKGINANTLDELKPKEQEALDPETEAYLKFRKETGRGYQDFMQTQKDWSQEAQEEVLKQVLKMKYPDLDEDEIQFKFKKQYSFDPDFDDEDVVMEKKINLKTDYREGLKLLESQKEQYMTRRSSDEFVPEDYKKAKEFLDNYNKQLEENQTVHEQLRSDFEQKTNELFSEKFEGFKFKVGDQEFVVKPEDVQQAKTLLSDVSNFDKKFFEETGKLKDPQGYYKALYLGMNADKMAEHFINLGMAMQAEKEERESKNIPLPGTRQVQAPLSNSSKPWTVLKD